MTTSAAGTRRAGSGGDGARSRPPGPARALAIAGALAACSAAGVGLGVLTILVLTGWIALAAPSVPQSLVAGFAVAAVSAGLGATRALAPWAQLGACLPASVRSVLVGSAGSLATLGAAGALLTALAMAGHARDFGAVNGLLAPGIVGAGLLFLAELGYLPNAVIWAISYLLGPGFAVGTGTIVAPTGSALGQLPAFPLLAMLPPGPHGSEPAWLTVLVLAAPYLAGLIGGLLVARNAPSVVLEAGPARGFCCGALAGVVLGVLAAFAGGPLGDGRLAAVGPSPWQVAVVCSLEVGIAAAVAAGAVSWRRMSAAARAAGPRLAADAGQGSGLRASGPDVAAAPGLTLGQPHLDQDQPNVIYLDRWADEPGSDQQSRRPRGPSVLP